MAKKNNPAAEKDTRPLGVKVASFFDQIVNFKQKTTRSRVTDYIPIKGIIDSHTYFDENNCLTSVFKVIGNLNIIGQNEINNIIKDTVSSLSSTLKRDNIQIQIVYTRDKKGSDAALRQYITPLKNKAESLGLNMEALLDEDAEMLREHMLMTEVYVAVTTSPFKLLSKEADKNARQELKSRLSPDFPTIMPTGMQYYMEADVARQQHISNVNDVRNLLVNNWKVSNRLLTLRETLKLYRAMLFPEKHTEGWEPVLPLFEEERGRMGGNYIDVSPIRLGDCEFAIPSGISHLSHPSLKKQLAVAPIRRYSFDSELAKFGNRFVATQLMTTMPQMPKSFDNLLENIPTDIPFRFSVTLYGGADRFRAAVSSKRAAAYVASFFSGRNKAIAKGCDTLFELMNSGVSMAGVNVQIATWAEHESQCSEQLRKISSALEQWGNAQSTTEYGDPALAFTAGIPGWSDQLRYIMVHGFDYMLDSLPYKMLSSPWQKGTMAFLDRENKLYLYQPISDKQQNWFLLGFAPPGGGKSVWLNCLVKAAILDPSQVGFPKIAAIDVGNSLKNAIRLYKKISRTEEVAEHFQHLEFELNEKFGINMLDLYTGCQKPLTHERIAQEAFLAFILTEIGEDKPIEGAGDLIKNLLDETYTEFIENPRLFDPSADKKLTEWAQSQPEAQTRLREKNITWWTLEQLAIAKGEYKIATDIHRYVVPTLMDLIGILPRSKTIASLFTGGRGRETITLAQRKLQTFVNSYPSLSKTSTFNYELSDICVIDLGKISKDQTPNGRRSTSLGFMAARKVLAKSMLFSRDLLEEMPETARMVYKEDVERLDTVNKYFLYDELHRMSGIKMITDVIEDDGRTLRKHNGFTGGFSQMYMDFTPAMASNSTTRVIMRVDKESEAKGLSEMYGWTSSTQEALRTQVKGAGRDGATFMMNATALQNMPDGTTINESTQVLKSFIGPTWLAAFSTNRADMALLSAVEDAGVPYEDAIRLLASIYGGSINNLVRENMMKLRENKQTAEEESEVRSLISPFVDKIVNSYNEERKRR